MSFVEIKFVDIVEAVKALILPLIVLKLKVPTMFAVIVPVLRKSALKVSAVIIPVLRKLVLRKPVLIGSKDVLMMPPFAIVIPPFTLMVDAFRVDGMPPPPPPPGGYAAPFTEDTLRLVIVPFALLIMKELIAAARTVFVLRVFVDMKEATTVFAFVVVVFIVLVVILPAKTVLVLMVIVLMDAALMAFPT
jgi:hypothetical protein